MVGPAQAQEWSEPARYVAGAGENATDSVFDRADRKPDHQAFARKVGAEWRPVTSREFADEVTRLAAGLVAAGVQPGDRVALMSGSSYEWALCDFAIMTAGAITVPIYETSSPTQISWILRDSAAVAVFVENDRLGALVTEAYPQAAARLWLMTGDGLSGLSAGGAAVPVDEVLARRRALSPDSLATIVYTSGTTGPPKGCLISHGNLLGEVGNVLRADGIAEQVFNESTSVLLFLPLAHVLARMLQHAAVRSGARLGLTSDLKNLTAELAAFRPTLVLAVPRVFEKFYNTATRQAIAAHHDRLFRAATATAIAYSKGLDSGKPSLWSRLARLSFDRLVYAKLRAAMGGQVQWAVSGGAPLGARLGHFFRGVGINILEGWGLTETTAGVTLNLPLAQRVGTVGRPLPGNAVRVEPDGEVLVKGVVVFQGYWHNEPATKEAFDEDGWFHTGDLGRLDDGYLSITGRKKDLIVTAAGKNVAPAFFEDRLAAHWLIDQCVVVGDQRPYVGALVTIDPESFEQWKKDNGKPVDATLADLQDDADLLSAVQSAIDDVNTHTSKAEAIKRFRIVATPFTIGEQLTPTQKVRRHYVLTEYADEVQALYTQPAASR